MTKFRTRLFSAVVAVAIAVTLVLPASAYGKDGESIVQQYTLGTKVSVNPKTFSGLDGIDYHFTIQKQMNVVLNWKSAGDAFLNLYQIANYIDENNYAQESVDPTKVEAVKTGNVTLYYSTVEVGATSEVNVTYSLVPGKYVFGLPLGNETFEFSFSEAGASAPVNKSVNMSTPFQRGSVVPTVTANRTQDSDGSEFTLTWSEVPSARYIVYYTARDEAGKYDNWTVKVVDRAELEALRVEAGKTLYLTILPFTDTPTRQYGGFSAYYVHHA